jgi:peptidoglycan/LPS O-acetylase OafA/YrhL
LAAAYEGAFTTFLFGNFYFNPNLWTITFEFFGSFLVFGLALLYLKIKRYQFVVVLGIAAIAASFQPFYLCFIAGIGLATVRQRLSGFNWPGLDRRWQAIGAVAAVALESGQPVSGCAEPLCRDGADYIVRDSGANHDFQQTHS